MIEYNKKRKNSFLNLMLNVTEILDTSFVLKSALSLLSESAFLLQKKMSTQAL